MIFRKKTALIFSAVVIGLIISLLSSVKTARAMPAGTLLYRSSSFGNLYGYNTEDLVVIKNKMLKNIYTGHVAIYIGSENGEDYIVEAMPNGIIKLPARYFLNDANEEKLIGAKIPKNLSPLQRAKVIELAKTLAESNLAYDFDFSKQKGPGSGEWTCVGLTEKLYESANIANPNDLKQLEYRPSHYAINLTPDGFDNYSSINSSGDCLSRDWEFSKISAKKTSLLPAPEIWGFNAGLEREGQRYFFLPLTQFSQKTLKDVVVDIKINNDFKDEKIRGKIPEIALIFRWSLINNPSSAWKNLSRKIVGLLFPNRQESLAQDNSSPDNNNSSEKEEPLEDASGEDNSGDSGSNTGEGNSGSSQEKENWEASGKLQGSIIIEENKNNSGNKEGETANSGSENNNQGDQEEGKEVGSEKDQPAKEEASKEEVPPGKTQPTLLLSKIYSTKNDDYVEIYNYGEESIDLDDYDLRLYKTKTAAQPTLMIRLGHLNDGVYRKRKIAPHSSYLIARSLANEEIKDLAQAIAERSDFGFTGKNQTIYLSAGVVSSNDDEDIIDQLGFGEAKYFLTKSAPEIPDGYLLMRKSEANFKLDPNFKYSHAYQLKKVFNSNNNSSDFLLVNLNIEEEEDKNSNPSLEEGSKKEEKQTEKTKEDQGNKDKEEGKEKEEKEEPKEEKKEEELPPLEDLLISKLYATLNHDYIEIFNPNDQAYDLLANNIRLYKTVTSATPTLMIRLGHANDASYPGGLVIPPYGRYLIARSEAPEEILSQAQAISTRKEFSFTGNGTIYLSSGVVSSDEDEDIVDKVGFGAASYYFQSPASEILDFHILGRKAQAESDADSMNYYGQDYNSNYLYNSRNNAFDFVLLDPFKSPEEEGSEEGEGLDGEEELDLLNYCPDPFAYLFYQSPEESLETSYCLHPGYARTDLLHLWHLDECQGNKSYDFISGESSFLDALWHPGKFGCGLKHYYNQSFFRKTLSPNFDSNNFTLMFYFQNTTSNARLHFKFSDGLKDYSILLYPYYTDFFNFPGAPRRDNDLAWPSLDDLWHLFSLVVNKEENYWALYLDGVQVFERSLDDFFFPDFKNFAIKGDNGYGLIDELSIFSRALREGEIRDIFETDLPLNSTNCVPKIEDKYPALFWPLEEDCSDLKGFYSLDLNPELESQNLSVSFWFKKRAEASAKDLILKLLDERGEEVLSFDLDENSLFFDFLELGFVLDLENLSQAIYGFYSDWTLINFVYDHYNFSFNFYINGNLILSHPLERTASLKIEKISLYLSEAGFYFQNLALWPYHLLSSDIWNLYFNF